MLTNASIEMMEALDFLALAIGWTFIVSTVLLTLLLGGIMFIGWVTSH